MLYKFSLIKTKHSASPLRTEDVVGVLAQEVRVGESLRLYSQPLDPRCTVRTITTSPIVRIEGNIIHTQNSSYLLEPVNEGSDFKIQN